MPVARGNQFFCGYSESGLLGVHRDPAKYIALNEAFSFTPEIVEVTARNFTPNQYHRTIEHLQGTWGGTFTMVYSLHPSEGIEFLKGALSDVTSSNYSGTTAYLHQFLGSDDVPMTEGFSLTVDEDIRKLYLSGCVVQDVNINSEVDNVVKVTVNGLVKKWATDTGGTAGISTGQNAVSFPATLVLNTSDKIKLAIDGGSEYECTITAGVYANKKTLQAAINAAIKAQANLLDSEGIEKVACFIGSDNKVSFHSATKGASSAVVWTAGTHDAGTILGRGTPVEAVGGTVLASVTYSAVQPFLTHQVVVKQAGAEIYCDNFNLTVNPGIMGKKYLGHKYVRRILLENKREVTGDFGKDYEDETQIVAWATNADVVLKLELRSGTVANGAYNYDADVFLNACRILNTPMVTSVEQGPLKQAVNFKSFYADATYRDIRVDFINLMTEI